MTTHPQGVAVVPCPSPLPPGAAVTEVAKALGIVPTIGRGTRRDGSRVSDTELDAVLRGRPGLGQSRATGRGRSPRRQVRLPEHTDAALTAYVEKHGTTASAVIRDAVEAYLATA